MLIRYRGSCPITDKKGRAIAVLCGHPKDPSWESAYVEAANTMRRSQCSIRRAKKSSQHRRGHFTALSAGVSFGSGQKVNYSRKISCTLLTSQSRSLVT
jgi:hypothetical protein